MIWLLIGYMYLFIHRPFEIWPGLGDLRIELLYMLVTGACWVTHPGKRWVSNGLFFAFFAFATAALLCVMASQFQDEGLVVLDRYFKLLIFFVMLVTVVQTEEDLRKIIIGFLGIMTLYMLHSLWAFHGGRHHFRMGIVRLIGVDATHGDPNAFGAIVVNALIFVLPLWYTVRSLGERLALMAYTLLSLGCIALTGSRTAFAVVLLFVAMVAALSPRRWQAAGVALLLMPVGWFALPESLQNRFETIIHPEVGPKNAQTSTEGRIEGFLVGIDLFQQSPMTGCGPGAWRPASQRELESHNVYGQVMGEMGLLGISTFFLVLAMYWRNVRSIARTYQQHPEWRGDFLFHLSRGLGMALVLLVVEGMTGHILFRFTWAWYGGFLLIARHCVDMRVQAEQEVEWEEAIDEPEPEWSVVGEPGA
jgi:O-antigen ligase